MLLVIACRWPKFGYKAGRPPYPVLSNCSHPSLVLILKLVAAMMTGDNIEELGTCSSVPQWVRTHFALTEALWKLPHGSQQAMGSVEAPSLALPWSFYPH